MNKVIQRQKREEEILLSLKKLDYLSRSQLQKIHRLGGDRNARRVLRNMSDYIYSFRDEENVYYLNKEGRQRVNSDKIRKKSPQVAHYLMRNSLYIAYNQPATWRNEIRIKDVNIITDAMFERGGMVYFIEVDCTQKMINNQHKIRKYRELSENNDFTLVWITTTEYRRRQLAKYCEGLTVRIHTIDDFK